MKNFNLNKNLFQKPVREVEKEPEVEVNNVANGMGQYQLMLNQQEKPQKTRLNLAYGNRNPIVNPDKNYNPDVTIIGLKEDKSLRNFHRAKVGMKEPLKTSQRFLARKRRSLKKQKKKAISGDLDQMNSGVSTFCSEGEVGCNLI